MIPSENDTALFTQHIPSEADVAPTFDYRLLLAHSLLHPQSPCVQGLVEAIDKKVPHLAVPLLRDLENLSVSPRHISTSLPTLWICDLDAVKWFV